MSKPTPQGALSLGALGTAMFLALSKDENLKNDAECMPKLMDMTSQVQADDSLKYNPWNGNWLTNRIGTITNSTNKSSYTSYKAATTDNILLGGFIDKLKHFINGQQIDVQNNLNDLAEKANSVKTSAEKVSIMHNMQYWLGCKNILKQLQDYVEENQTVSI